MGQTRDDAAGEAFDKVSKMLGLGYPGGPVISKQAEAGDPDQVRFPRVYLDKNAFDFSFSGLKTAVNRYIQTQTKDEIEKNTPHIAAGFQEAVIDVLVHKIILAAQKRTCNHIALVGGVAANPRLRSKLTKKAQSQRLNVYLPSIAYCGDNAAMIAAAGFHFLQKGDRAALDSDVYSRVPIGG
jgi:N6-L-threonylcarbamoyladenine synthase